MKKTKFLSLLLLGLLCSIGNMWGDTAYGFENNKTSESGYPTSAGDGSRSISSSISRTGNYSLEQNNNNTSAKLAKIQNLSVSFTGKLHYVHYIAYLRKNTSNDVTLNSHCMYAGSEFGKVSPSSALTSSWSRITNKAQRTGNTQSYSSVEIRFQTTTSTAGDKVYIDDVVAYVTDSDVPTDLTAPSSATSATATTAQISWSNGTDSGTGATGIQNTLIWKRTSGSNDLSLNDQGIYSLTATEGPSTDQTGKWTLISASVAADATSYSGTFKSGDVYAIVHRDLAYNYSTPTYVTIPASGAYTITKGSPIGGTFSTSKTSADEGDEITLTATPNDGYSFTSWIVTKDEDESDVTGGVVVGNTLIMPDYNVTVNVTFTAIEYIITHAVVEHGFYTIKVPGRSAVDINTTANVGQTITLAAEPEDGYYLSSWSVTKTIGGSDVSMATENTFVMPAEDVTVAPTFRQLTCATPSISPADGSSFSGASQTITLACETGGATIYYTLDGSTPTALSDNTNTYDPEDKPVISSTTTIKAIAVKGGYVNSDVASATIKKVIPGTWGSWDFTNWSPATISGTGSDSEKWYDHEKSGGTGVDFTDGKGAVNKTAISTAAVIKYGTTEIEETKDLRFTADAYQFALVYNVPSALNTYHGSQYIWLFKSSSVITIPSVPANAIIEIATETHKNTAARYVTLKNGSTTLTMTQGATEGAAALEYQVCKWTNISTAGDVTITPSAGLHIYYITVTANVETVPVTKRDDRTYGTFVAPCGLDFSGVANMDAYIAKAINGTTSVSISKVTKVPAGTAFIVKTDPIVDLANVPVTTSATASDVEGNLLVAGDGETAWNGTAGYTYYYLASDAFHNATSGTLQSGKAYLKVEGDPTLAPSLRIVEGEQNATDIQSIESADKAVKFIENGRILILRDGITYDALGRIVK